MVEEPEAGIADTDTSPAPPAPPEPDDADVVAHASDEEEDMPWCIACSSLG
jgi:hypothetical protein